MSIVCNICENFNISKLNCICRKNKEDDHICPNEIEFDLIKSEKKRYSELIPNEDNYLYLKIIKNETIIALSGETFLELPFEEKDVINKKLSEIKIYPVFFIDYIRPLFLTSMEKGEAYQFDFRTNITERLLTCSIYPCSMPGAISSCDIVIRYSHQVLNSLRISELALRETSDKGEKVDTLY